MCNTYRCSDEPVNHLRVQQGLSTPFLPVVLTGSRNHGQLLPHLDSKRLQSEKLLLVLVFTAPRERLAQRR